MSEENDIFMDKTRLQKMIAFGIYGNEMIHKLTTFAKSNDNSINTSTNASTNSSTKQSSNATTPSTARDNKPLESLRTQSSDSWRPSNSMTGFKPIENSAFKWSDTWDRKRRRTPSPVRQRQREEIQNKISRDEMERKLNVEYFNSNKDNDQRINLFNDNKTNNNNNQNTGNCVDTDLRSKSDIDSRLRDTDCRPNQSLNRKNADNLPFIASTANDEDLRSTRIDERDERNLAFRQQFIEGVEKRVKFNRTNTRFNTNSSNFFDKKRSKPEEKKETIEDIDAFIKQCNSKPEPKKPQAFDDIDDFIKQCEMKLESNAPKNRGREAQRARGNDRRPNQNQRQDNTQFNRGDNQDIYSRNNAPQNRLNRNESFNNRFQDLNTTGSSSVSEPIRNTNKDIEILRETVEELTKSNLYCQYCDCYLSSLIEVNSHIGTLVHQQNMAKQVMAHNNVKIEPNNQNDLRINNSELIPAINEPKGMEILVKLIEDRKQITLKTLTEMVFMSKF